MPTSQENPVTIEGMELGRYLFYDPILSLNYDISCATCHKQQYAFSSHTERKLDKNNSSPRNVLPLFNLAWYSSFFWDGRAKSIEEQIFHPVRNSKEMNLHWSEAVKRIQEKEFYSIKFKEAFNTNKIDSVIVTKAIAQFVRTLISYQSKYDRVLNGEAYFTEDEYQGFVLMNDMTKGDCLHCHTTDSDALGTFGTFSNNGLNEAAEVIFFSDKGLGGFTNKFEDYGKFKIPSLRNLLFTAPYMHDGRFKTLEEVLDFYSEGVKNSITVDSKMGMAHQGGVKLNELEKKQIISFLKTLSDSVFISKPEFSNPFN